MSTIILSAIVSLLATILPLMGIELGTEQLTPFVQNIVYIVTGVYIWFARVRHGDVNALGVRK